MNKWNQQQAEIWRDMETFNNAHAKLRVDAGLDSSYFAGRADAYGVVADEYENVYLNAPQGQRITCTCNNWPDGCYNAKG